MTTTAMATTVALTPPTSWSIEVIDAVADAVALKESDAWTEAVTVAFFWSKKRLKKVEMLAIVFGLYLNFL